MLMTLVAISPAEIVTLEANPESTGDFISACWGEDPTARAEQAAILQAGSTDPGTSLWRRLWWRLAGGEPPPPVEEAAPETQSLWWPIDLKAEARPLLDLDKDWHALHWLLTGTAWETDLPAGFLLGGQEIGDDVGYGPLRVITAEETAAVARHLASERAADLTGRLDPAAMAKAALYPPGEWFAEPMLAENLMQWMEELDGFVRARVERGEGLAIWLD